MKVSASLLLAVAALGLASPVNNNLGHREQQPDVKVNYDGYKVYRVPFADDDATIDMTVNSLAAIELQRRRDGNGGWAVELAVAPLDIAAFEATHYAGASTVLSDDLGAELAAELRVAKSAFSASTTAAGALPGLEWFNAYHPYADHVNYWADLHAALPNNSELITVGNSFERRPIQGIHLWGASGKDSKPAIFFNGNVHAREWITSMVSLFILLPSCSTWAHICT